MKTIKENSEKFISLGGIVVSVIIIFFALTYEIKTETHNETMKNTSEKIVAPSLEK